jgi:hypothetical protein
MPRIAVIVDSTDPAKRRYCFWSDVLSRFPQVEFEEISFPEKRRNVKYVDLDDFDIIIFNWDVTDGDFTFESDITQAIVKRRQHHFRNFVRSGGLLIAECQSSHWKPEQSSYDLLFGENELRVAQFINAGTGTMGHINLKLRGHPFLRLLSETISNQYFYPKDLQWFPPHSVSPRAIDLTRPTKLYSGWFTKWRVSWLPLIFEAENRFPIMLAKVDGNGLYIATTMFLASSGINLLVQNIVAEYTKHRTPPIILFHEKAVRRQRIERLASRLKELLPFLLVAALIYVILRYLADLRSLMLELLLSIAVSALLWIAKKVAEFILRVRS